MDYDEELIDETPVEMTEPEEAPEDQSRPEPDEAEKKLVSKLRDRIMSDRKYHGKAFKQMRVDMEVARRGAPAGWPKSNYVANITGRHIKTKTTALYAKNPKSVARRPEKLDFEIWDENEQTLMQALEIMQAAQTMVDPVTGIPSMDPMLMAQVQQAQELLADYKQGTERKMLIEKLGKTLEILFHYFMREQAPVDFKTSMKKLVRRACTTCVGYVMLGFQRGYEEDRNVTTRIADFRDRLDKIGHLSEEVEEDDFSQDTEAKRRELEISLKSLEEEMYILVREGLTFDFLKSTAVIPDLLCTSLEGFEGARWLTVERMHTPDEIERKFRVKLKRGEFTKYRDNGLVYDDEGVSADQDQDPEDLACVWQHFDKETGVVYLMCDGYPGFLRDPGKPDVYVDDFWPVYGLTFNEVEDDKNLYPPSDVQLMLDMQNEYNRSRQGKREHRKAARPRFFTRKGALDDESKTAMRDSEPFEVIEVNPLDGTENLQDLVQAFNVPGVDPNLYDTNEIFADIQLTVGSSESQFGMASGATATESSIAQSAQDATTGSDVDDLDGFLTRVARAAGQIMLKEMSPEMVKKIVGPGAVWPQMTLEQISSEMFLEVQAGSSGKPNQVQELRNWERMMPFLLQMPNIGPTWLAREFLSRLDDRMDLTEAVTENIPSIMAMNGMAQAAANNPSDDPAAQGGAGASNAPATPGGPSGTDDPGGNNQQAIM